jgi:quinol monooxygenase YgiN
MADDIRLVAMVHVKPGEENAVREAALACVAPSRAEAANHMYTFNQDSEDPSLFVFVEHWESKAALDEHMKTPHFKTMAAVFEGKLAKPLGVHILKPL